MAELRVAPEAERDLDHILAEGIAEFGVVSASRQFDGFERLFALLRHTPHAGQEQAAISSGLRALSHRPHRILYRVEGDVVIVLRVLHHARDLRGTLDGNA